VCPAGTSSWAGLVCGIGRYCPAGSSTPTPCPLSVPPPAGQLAQGPAFVMETAVCLNHCFWNYSSGTLSTC
jgi:hypothetical protein